MLSGIRLQPGEEAVLLCARAERTASEIDRIRYLLRAERGRERFWTEAARQQVVPLVAHVLTSSPIAGTLPPEILKEAREQRLQTLFYNMAVHAEMRAIGEALKARGIPVAPLKGTHVAERLFGALEARQVGDIDVLVQKERLLEARETLKEMGYGTAPDVTPGIEEHTFHGVPYVRYGPATRFVVELHWGLNNPRFVTVDYPRLWNRILSTSTSEVPLRPLPTEETLLFLALHLPKHDTGSLRLLADIDRLLRGEGATLDWRYTLDLAGVWNVRSLLYFALRRAQMLLDAPIPTWVMREVTPSSWRRSLVGLLAGPRALLRPPITDHLRGNRFRLAYCAMLTPSSRSLDAYLYYLYSSFGAQEHGTVSATMALSRRIARGFAWTAVILGTAVAEQWSEALGRSPSIGSGQALPRSASSISTG